MEREELRRLLESASRDKIAHEESLDAMEKKHSEELQNIREQVRDEVKRGFPVCYCALVLFHSLTKLITPAFA